MTATKYFENFYSLLILSNIRRRKKMGNCRLQALVSATVCVWVKSLQSRWTSQNIIIIDRIANKTEYITLEVWLKGSKNAKMNLECIPFLIRYSAKTTLKFRHSLMWCVCVFFSLIFHLLCENSKTIACYRL